MPLSLPTAAGIDQKLRNDFRNRLKDYGITADSSDPVLALLFRSVAKQLEVLYTEIDGIRLALLDELISGLGFPNRAARAAQTIVRFGGCRNSENLRRGTALAGETETGQKLVFATDADVIVSGARIAVAAIYQSGTLRLMGIEMPDEVQAARPSLEPLSVSLGGCPAIYLAIDNLPSGHLSGHSLFFEISSDAPGIARALQTENWCLATHDGVFEARGILRPHQQNAGVRSLAWLMRKEQPAESTTSSAPVEFPELPDGFYAGRCFIFPDVPDDGEFLCRCPRAMETAFQRLFGSPQSVLNKDRAWIRISMPQGIGNLSTALHTITLHAISASNIECFNQTVYFDKHGTSIPVGKDGGAQYYLVAPISIFGESGSEYVPKFQPTFDDRVGRYTLENGRIGLTPARNSDDRPDTYVNLRLWLTAGARAKEVGPGKIQEFAEPAAAGLRISNLTAAAGGADEESFAEARSRFAEAVLSRDRLITRSDVITALRAFDRRVLGATLAAGLERGAQGMKRIQQITVQLNREDFIDPLEEGRILAEEIRLYFGQQFFYDMDLAISLEWK
jgi:hypothetical protein